MKLGEVINFQTGKLNSNAAVPNGKYPFFTCAPEPLTINTFSFDEDCVLLAGNNANGDFNVKRYNGKFDAYQRTYIITAKPGTSIDYLFYALKLALNKFKQMSQGTATRFLTAEILRNFEVEFPLFETQCAIAATLSCLDNKIALNTKINHHLEQMAQAIFKSWFVDFEPWGGERPTNWRDVKLGDLCLTITKGTTPTTLKKQFVTQGINFVKAESILDDHSFDFSKLAFIDEETNSLLSRSMIQANDIVFTIAGTLGRFAFIGEDLLPANTNQAVAIIRVDASQITPITLYSFFIGGLHSDFYTKNIQQAVQANLSLTTIKALPLILPPKENLAEYSALIEPLLKQIFQNYTENRRLATLRDTLLPRLMSGELSVSDL